VYASEKAEQTSKATSSTDDIDSVAIISDSVYASESANLKRICCGILRKYGVASLSHPMVVHLCDDVRRPYSCDA